MTGHELRALRLRVGQRRRRAISQKEFALRLDIPYSTYRRWEYTPGAIPRHAAALLRAYLLGMP